MTTDVRKTELEAQIELASNILRETRSTRYIKDYWWLQNERARLVRELAALQERGEQP